jgi:hypothetical protein
MSLLSDIKVVLRVSDSTTAFDTEINDLIAYAQEDLVTAGVLQSIMTLFIATPDAYPLIKRAVITYNKAEFGWNNPNIDDFKDSYKMQKMRLTLVDSYITEVT